MNFIFQFGTPGDSFEGLHDLGGEFKLPHIESANLRLTDVASRVVESQELTPDRADKLSSIIRLPIGSQNGIYHGVDCVYSLKRIESPTSVYWKIEVENGTNSISSDSFDPDFSFYADLSNPPRIFGMKEENLINRFIDSIK